MGVGGTLNEIASRILLSRFVADIESCIASNTGE